MRAKTLLFEQFALVGKGLAHPARLQLLDLLAQSEYAVEPLAAAAGLPLSTASAHLKTLRASQLVTSRREGTRIVYSLAGDDVAALLANVREVASSRVAGVEPAKHAYLRLVDDEATEDDPAWEEIGHDELLRRARQGQVAVLDVRPAPEYEAGHIPGAVHIPVDELEARIDELPDIEVVAYCRGEYCVMSYDAVRLLTRRGRRAVRLAAGMLEWRLAGRPVQTTAA
ncbi:ArsR/SmtB family transcription factor [Actinomycetospora straminea]|uniref:Metalloregulator ArsR/SmtB family transcription factor n=1 Tax=Actinomycetospora straminea TaxID=663607 RepID=A0ABP9F7K1_9PSEU|nr:metalloregulator ArsR/SmtB family transcription factor [Actinomycetospora straminea]MDD7934810.1 metalloregulator ArsR/SmtB family transcription factor [Actinomycetospora straminea]